MTGSPNSTGSLQRMTVIVLLGLLVFVTFADWLDAVMGQGTFEPNPGLYTLVGGIIAGLFSAEAIKSLRSRSSNCDTHKKDEPDE